MIITFTIFMLPFCIGLFVGWVRLWQIVIGELVDIFTELPYKIKKIKTYIFRNSAR